MFRLLAAVPLLALSGCGMLQTQPAPAPVVYTAPVAQQPAPRRVVAQQPRRVTPAQAQSGSDGGNTPDAPSAPSNDGPSDGSDVGETPGWDGG